MFPACQGHIVGEAISVLDLKGWQRERRSNRAHVRELEQGQAPVLRTERDARDAQLRGEVASEVLLQVSGIHAVVIESGFVSRVRVEDVGFAESGAGVEIVVESSRSFVATTAGRLKDCGMNTGLNLITIA